MALNLEPDNVGIVVFGNDRLIKEGYSRDEARRLISCVVAVELSDMLRTEQPFDEARFVLGLSNLPNLPE